MPSCTVRLARPDERLAVAKVHVQTWKAAYRGIIPDDFLDGLDADDRAAAYDATFLTDPLRPVWVADNGGVVGFASAGPSRDENDAGELYAIYVDASQWGGAAGVDLMTTAVEFLRKRYAHATLWVLKDNVRARRFYEKHEWYLDGAEEAFSRGSFSVPEVRYRIDLR